jgi:hypothetical protein
LKRLRNRQLTIQRVVLIVFGIVLLGAAVLGALLSLNVLTLSPIFDPETSVLNANSDRFIAAHTTLLRMGGMAGGLVAAALSLYWLKLQLPPAHHQDDVKYVTTTKSAEHGQELIDVVVGETLVEGKALAHAFESDLLRFPEIRQARAELRLAESTIRLRLDVDQSSSLPELLSGPVQTALERLTRVAEFATTPMLYTDVRLVEAVRAKVA